MASETPICDALIQHVSRARGPLHVPGHQQGATLPEILVPWLGHAAKLDLTELPGLDNLAQPEECILESEQLAAQYYGSNQCLYSVNGSSAGVMAALMATTTPQSTVLFANPFHISAWYGLVHSGANALRLPTRYTSAGKQEPMSHTMLEQTLEAHPEIGVVYVTSPNYQGDCTDVGAIARVAHEHGAVLIVDEAHGAHFGLIPEFPQHSVQAGADVVIHSVHKMLPGLTQTAWIHRLGTRVNGVRLAETLRSLQTSSPSYLLLASIDAAQHWLRTKGPQEAGQTLERLRLYGLVTGQDRSGDGPGGQRDPLKQWVPAPSLTAAKDLQQRFAQQGLYVEYIDETGVLSVLGLGLRESIVRDYVRVVREWERTLATTAVNDMTEVANQSDYWKTLDAVSEFTESFFVSPREAGLLPQEHVPLGLAAGRLAATPLSPYPPGVPLIYPGQPLSAELLEVFQGWVKSGLSVQGISRDGTVAVLR